MGAPTIGWSEFARKNSAAGTGNSYSSLTEEQIVMLVKANWGERTPGAGEDNLNRKVLVPVPSFGFLCPPRAKLVPGLPIKAEVFVRQEGEDPYVQTYVTTEDAIKFGALIETPAKVVEIVCYSAEALLENGGTRSTHCDWEIITLLCGLRREPMTPLTMARNFLEKTGGTKGIYTAREFANAIWYWSQQGVRVKSQ